MNQFGESMEGHSNLSLRVSLFQIISFLRLKSNKKQELAISAQFLLFVNLLKRSSKRLILSLINLFTFNIGGKYFRSGFEGMT
ncbi:MAG TPA: hypothetical protein VFF80_04105, partial [Bacillota bacterium]|nr:hypothetical protein [Bacillota bacterium]